MNRKELPLHPMEARDRRLRIYLLVPLLAWSFLLRVWVATPELNSRRFPDERFGRDNIRALLLHGAIRPDNRYYPSLSYLPQAALLAVSHGLHRATGREVFRVFDAGEGFTPTAFLLCRLLQALFGTLSIYLTFKIGSRLFSAPVGLAGALLLSVIDWHLRQSVIFKPDILLLTTSLLAFLWSLDAAERPGWRRYLLAGIGIGLALASKYNAAPIALPLFVATVAGGAERDRRRWGWLALAAAAAAAVFVLLNPFVLTELSFYVRDFQETVRHYGKKGASRRGTHWALPWHALQTLLSRTFHGQAVGILGLLGGVGLGVAALRRPWSLGDDSRARWTGRLMALAFVVGYTLLYSLATTYPSPHNWLVLAPFSSLFAAWAVDRIWHRLATRWPKITRAGAVAAAAAVLLLVLSSYRTAYSSAVPMTWREAERLLNGSLHPMRGRLVVYERRERRLVLGLTRGKPMIVETTNLTRIPPGALDRADAELFPEDRLSGAEGDFYRRRIAALSPQQVVRIHPAGFRLRGPSLAVLVHPWRKVGRPLAVDLSPPEGAPGELLAARLPGLAPDELGSLVIDLPARWKGRMVHSLRLGDRPLAWTSFGGTTETVATDRFDAAEARGLLVVRLQRPSSPGEGQLRARLLRWRR